MSIGDACWACMHELEDHDQKWPHPCDVECDCCDVEECDCCEFMPIDYATETQNV